MGALKSADVDNSIKEIAFTLVWEHNCDLDIHVIEPNGFEIFYQAKNSPNTGNLDVDMTKLGPNGISVENVSWTTAPAGSYQVSVKNYNKSCPTIDYKLY